MKLDSEHLAIMTAKDDAPQQESHKAPGVEAHRR